MVDNVSKANVIVKLEDLRNGRGWDHGTATAKVDINRFKITLFIKPYFEGRVGYFADQRDWNASSKAIAMAVTKILKENKLCNDCEIEVKVSYTDDGFKILEYRDNLP